MAKHPLQKCKLTCFRSVIKTCFQKRGVLWGEGLYTHMYVYVYILFQA